jgi:hypothetical protein
MAEWEDTLNHGPSRGTRGDETGWFRVPARSSPQPRIAGETVEPDIGSVPEEEDRSGLPTNRVDGQFPTNRKGACEYQAMGAAARLRPNSPEAWTFHEMRFGRLQLLECQTPRRRGGASAGQLIPSKCRKRRSS